MPVAPTYLYNSPAPPGTGYTPSYQAYPYAQQPVAVPATGSCNCAQCSAQAQAAGSRSLNPATAQKAPCATCGSQTRGCTLLQGFATNSALLGQAQQQQLRQLAYTLLRRGAQAVMVTGYTTSRVLSGNNIGRRRALAAVTELKRQLSLIRPGAGNNLRYRTAARPGGRQVSICVRQTF